MGRHLVVKGDTIEEQLDSIDRILSSLQRSPNKKQIQNVHAIPIHIRAIDVTQLGVLTEMVFDTGGEITGGFSILNSCPKCSVIVSVRTSNILKEYNLVMSEGENSFKTNAEIPNNSIITVSLRDFEGDKIGKLIVCLSFFPTFRKVKV